MPCNCDGGPHLNKSATIACVVGYDWQSASQRLAISFPTTADRLCAPRSNAPTLHLQIPKQHREAIYYLIKFIYIIIYINYLYINYFNMKRKDRKHQMERWSVGAHYFPCTLGSGPKVKSRATVLWRQTRGLRFSLWGQTRGLASDYCSSSLDVRRMMLVAPRVKRVPSSITRRSRGLSSTLSTKVPVLLLLSFRVYLRFPRLSRLTVIVQ